MKVKQHVCLWVAVLLVLVSLTACAAQPASGAPKTITFTVVDNQQKETAYTIETTAEKLADALLEEGIIAEKASDGYYTTIAGITADYAKDQSWWCLTQDGEMTNYGLNDQTIKDGDKFEATYTIG